MNWHFRIISLKHLQIGRSAGFNVGVSYAPHRQQTQQPQGSPIISTSSAAGSFSGSNSLDLLQMHLLGYYLLCVGVSFALLIASIFFFSQNFSSLCVLKLLWMRLLGSYSSWLYVCLLHDLLVAFFSSHKIILFLWNYWQATLDNSWLSCSQAY